MDIDACLQQAGEFGPIQKRIYYVVNLMNVLAAMQTLAPAFIAYEPEWTCDSQSPPKEQQAALQRCTLFEQGLCQPQYLSGHTTIVTEWDLICRWSYLPKLSQSVYFVGMMLGSWSLGSLAERLGRKKVYFLSIGLYAFSALGCGVAPNLTFFTLFRAGMGVSDGGLVVTMYVLSMELVGPTQRTYPGVMCQAFFSGGFVLLACLAYLISSWRVLMVVGAVMCFANLFTWRMIPESPRWLVLKGRVAEAEQLLTQIAEGNGKHLANTTFELKRPGKDALDVSILDLFRGKVIRRRTLVLSSYWCAVCMVYYALSLSAGDLGGNRYLSFVLSGLIEIPSYILTIVVLNRWGRRYAICGFLLTGGVLCLLCAVLMGRGGTETLVVGLSLAGKFAVSASFAAAYLYAIELFPTQIRNLGVGVCSLSARIGGIASPLILLTDKWGASVPMGVMGTIAVAAGALSSVLPETMNKPLPETLTELDSLHT